MLLEYLKSPVKSKHITLMMTFTCRKPSFRFLEMMKAFRNRNTLRSPQLPITRNTS